MKYGVFGLIWIIAMCWLMIEEVLAPSSDREAPCPKRKTELPDGFLRPVANCVCGHDAIDGGKYFLDLKFLDGDSNTAFTNFASALVVMPLLCGGLVTRLVNKKSMRLAMARVISACERLGVPAETASAFHQLICGTKLAERGNRDRYASPDAKRHLDLSGGVLTCITGKKLLFRCRN